MDPFRLWFQNERLRFNWRNLGLPMVRWMYPKDVEKVRTVGTPVLLTL